MHLLGYLHKHFTNHSFVSQHYSPFSRNRQHRPPKTHLWGASNFTMLAHFEIVSNICQCKTQNYFWCWSSRPPFALNDTGMQTWAAVPDSRSMGTMMFEQLLHKHTVQETNTSSNISQPPCTPNTLHLHRSCLRSKGHREHPRVAAAVLVFEKLKRTNTGWSTTTAKDLATWALPPEPSYSVPQNDC